MTNAKTPEPGSYTDAGQLDETLKETFPASDASSGNRIEEKATRPIDRRPAPINEAEVDKLAEDVKEKIAKK